MSPAFKGTDPEGNSKLLLSSLLFSHYLLSNITNNSFFIMSHIQQQTGDKQPQSQQPEAVEYLLYSWPQV